MGKIDFNPLTFRSRIFGKDFFEIQSSVSSDKLIEVIHNNDALLTETVKATVQAYTDLENLNKLWDYTRYWLALSANEKYDAKQYSLSGGVFGFGTLDVVIDGAAGQAFDSDGLTTTIKAATFDGGLETTGTITLDAIAENKTVRNASLVSMTTLPSVLTVDNTILELSPGGDVTDYIELNGGSYRATADGTYYARGKSAGLIDANGFSITVETDVIVSINCSTFEASSNLPIQGARVYLEADTGGPLVAGTEILNALTNASGVASTTFIFTLDQPVIGRIRKGTNSPFYKTAEIAGTISLSGLNITTIMIKD